MLFQFIRSVSFRCQAYSGIDLVPQIVEVLYANRYFASDNDIVRHYKTMEILLLTDILSCSGHIRINLQIIALVIIFLEPLQIGG